MSLLNIVITKANLQFRELRIGEVFLLSGCLHLKARNFTTRLDFNRVQVFRAIFKLFIAHVFNMRGLRHSPIR